MRLLCKDKCGLDISNTSLQLTLIISFVMELLCFNLGKKVEHLQYIIDNLSMVGCLCLLFSNFSTRFIVVLNIDA